MGFTEQIKRRALELYQGCSAAQALTVLEKESPGQHVPTERTIRRWHNKELLEKHFEHMAGMAASLISGFGEVYKHTPRGNQLDILEYSFCVDGDGFSVTREWLGSKLAAQIETVTEQCSSIDWKSFLPHIITEFPEVERIGLASVANTNPYELLQTLKRMATEKSFQGKCPTCEHLH